MNNKKEVVCLVATSLLLVKAPSSGHAEMAPGAPEGAAELAGVLVRGSSHLFPPEARETLDELNRRLREAGREERRAESDSARAEASEKAAKAAQELLEILPISEATIPFDLMGEIPSPPRLGPVALTGDSGSFLLRVATGDAEKSFAVADVDLSAENFFIEVETIPDGVTWALVRLRQAPVDRTSIFLKFRIGSGREVTVPFEITTPEHGRLRLSVLSDDSGQPAPAMLRLTSSADGQSRQPGNAVDMASQWGGWAGDYERNANLPGQLRGAYWCIPGPLDMALPPGRWEVIVRRGLEHEAVFDTFTVESGEVLERTYRPRRWVNMPKLGWYSGDDHVHSQILSDADARRLMAWVQAEDIHLANVVKMGDIHRTWFEQRGYGKDYRVRDGDYILSPGQECPRTHRLGHVVAMNISEMVRDTEKYFLYDRVFDQVHAQGGLIGYCHVNRGLFNVHRGMSVNLPQENVDFAELLQFGELTTDLYYEFLNTGFRLTASSGSDVPWGGTVGEGRLFAYIGDGDFSADVWFEAVRRGWTFVTNGPMLDFRVAGALPGDTITLAEDRLLTVRVRAWGDARRVLPTKLEIVKQGEVIARAEPAAEEEELIIELELDSEQGFWLAARAEGSGGALAHTTPIYVIREPFRFWKYEEAEDLIAKRLGSLAEIEEVVATAIDSDSRGEAEANRPIEQLALQAPALLERVKAARQFYEGLKQIYEREKSLRDLQEAP